MGISKLIEMLSKITDKRTDNFDGNMQMWIDAEESLELW